MPNGNVPTRSSRLSGQEILQGLRPYGKASGKTYSVHGRQETVYAIGELAKALGRRPGTIRKWEELGILPKAPWVLRGDGHYANRRLYSAAHVIGIVRIAEAEGVLDPNDSRTLKDTAFKERVHELFRALSGTAAA